MGARTFPSSDTFDPYWVLEGLMANEPIRQWTRLLGSSSYDSASSISIAADGSIYITGFIRGSLDGQTNSGDADVFISKYSSDGTKAWTRLLGSSSLDDFCGVTAAKDGVVRDFCGSMSEYQEPFLRKMFPDLDILLAQEEQDLDEFFCDNCEFGEFSDFIRSAQESRFTEMILQIEA